MKRIKRHKVKTEAAETSTSHNREQEIHDLAYYIHDRVELMHQVFSVIKYKDLKAMVPASIRNISLDDLQELCTEELLGISSKRLCAILDGAEPPSDTESSSPSPPPDPMETISLDSISSDDEILSQSSSKKKKHKHRRHSKSKSKRRKSTQEDGEADRNKASRAGLTVLELLELQARARAIRAQLQQEQQNKPVSESTSKEPPNSSDNEVEIKEEPAEVVEISSDEEKPKIEELQNKITQETTVPPQTTITKRINDLVITVPQKAKQKIKLNRNKITPTTINKPTSIASPQKAEISVTSDKNNTAEVPKKNVKKDKVKRKKKGKDVTKDDIDNDEITLQLSDTEKMDLLEDLDRKHYDSVSSCSENSSESSSDSDESGKPEKDKVKVLLPEKHKERDVSPDKYIEKETLPEKDKERQASSEKDKESPPEKAKDTKYDSNDDGKKDTNNKDKADSPVKVTPELTKESSTKAKDTENNSIKDTTEPKDCSKMTDTTSDNMSKDSIDLRCKSYQDDSNKDINENKSETAVKDSVTTKDITIEKYADKDKESEKNLSEGELSDRESSEVETVELKPEVVCISDEEGKKSKKKKKKKDKKSKKVKKFKKKSDFRESGDQNFYKEIVEEKSENQLPYVEIEHRQDTSRIEIDITVNTDEIKKEDMIDQHTKSLKIDCSAFTHDDIEAVYEILELSDDSSCCEVELSKEPTASEIEALSAKIDEIEREEVITDKEIRDYEREKEAESIENVSWKDRYLDSKKVKKVLSTANILNALRKKNIELKKKLAESKVVEEAEETEKKDKEQNDLEEGTIEHYNTLETLTTYVDPVKELPKDLKKDAKLLLKMYKKLLKYNDMNKPEDPNKRKKKKKKSKKKDEEKKTESNSVGKEGVSKDNELFCEDIELNEIK